MTVRRRTRRRPLLAALTALLAQRAAAQTVPWLPPTNPVPAAPPAAAPPPSAPAAGGSPAGLPWLPPTAATAGDATPVAATAPAAPATRLGLDTTLFFQHFAFDPQFSEPPVRGTSNYLRGVLDFRRTEPLATGVDLTLSDRLDYLLPFDRFDPTSERQGAINALRELYVSTRLDRASTLTFELGRINVRNGVGAGYNPTDFFKESAVITTTSRDPGALRYNRLGTVMAQLNYVADWGSATVAAVPELQRPTSLVDLARPRPGLYLGLDRTNSADAVFAKVSPRINDQVSLDLLAYARAHRDPSFGFDTSVLLTSAVVGNLELAVVHNRPASAFADLGLPPRWSTRLAANLTWTTPMSIELTAEVTHAGDALDQQQWDDLRFATDPASIGRLQRLATERSLQQEPLTQTGYFLYAGWRDAFAHQGLSLAAFVTGNFYDGSTLWQVSAGQSFGAWTVGAIASGVTGSGVTEFGASEQRTYLALSLTRRF